MCDAQPVTLASIHRLLSGSAVGSVFSPVMYVFGWLGLCFSSTVSSVEVTITPRRVTGDGTALCCDGGRGRLLVQIWGVLEWARIYVEMADWSWWPWWSRGGFG